MAENIIINFNRIDEQARAEWQAFECGKITITELQALVARRNCYKALAWLDARRAGGRRDEVQGNS